MEPVTILWQSPDTQAPSSASVAPYQPKYSKQVQTLAFCFRHLVSSIYVAAILMVLRRFCGSKHYLLRRRGALFSHDGAVLPGVSSHVDKRKGGIILTIAARTLSNIFACFLSVPVGYTTNNVLSAGRMPFHIKTILKIIVITTTREFDHPENTLSAFLYLFSKLY